MVHHQNLKIMRNQKSFFQKSLFIIPLLLIVGFMSNNKDSKNQQTAVLTDSRNSVKENTSFDLRNFPVLMIRKDSIIRLFEERAGEPKVHKVVFKFYVDLTEKHPRLAVFRARNNDRRYISKAYDTLRLTPSGKTCDISGVYTLGNLELRHKVSATSDEHSWEKILKKFSTGDTHLFFYPMLVDDHVTYVLAWGTGTPLDCAEAKKIDPVDGGLNPSPPADPG